MKKLIIKDKSTIKEFLKIEKNKYVLSSIFNNNSYPFFIRRTANKQLQNLTLKHSISAMKSRCKKTINKKNYNKLTKYTRHVFLKIIRFGNLNGFQKSSW